jgi:hypothetical protein
MSETRFVDSFIRWGSLAAVQGVGIGSAVDVHDVQPLGAHHAPVQAAFGH